MPERLRELEKLGLSGGGLQALTHPSGSAMEPGTKLSPYEITEQLSAGGMGEVYRARDRHGGFLSNVFMVLRLA